MPSSKLPLIPLLFAACSLHGAITLSLTSVDEVTTFPPPSPLPNTEFFANDGTTLLSAGNRILIGSFDLGGSSAETFFSNNTTNLTGLLSAFQGISDTFSYESASATDPLLDAPGQVGSISAWSTFIATPSTSFGLTSSDPIYLWVFKTTDDSADLGTDFSNVIEFGVFSSTATTWRFTDSEAPILRTEDINLFYISGNDDLSLATAVPEPSIFALMGSLLVMSCLIIRRRLQG